MSFPIRYTVKHRQFLSTGRAGDVFAPAVDRGVYGWEAHQSSDGTDDRVVADLDLLAPLFPVQPRDQFDLPDEGTLVVSAARENWDTGPFGYEPGMVVPLRRVDG